MERDLGMHGGFKLVTVRSSTKAELACVLAQRAPWIGMKERSQSSLDTEE